MFKFYVSVGIFLFILILGVVFVYPIDRLLFIIALSGLVIIYTVFLFVMSMMIRMNFFLSAINKNTKKELLLTFDDGPHPEHTLKILDILDEYDSKAIFFMMGKNVITYPSITKEVALRGHQIGIHSQNHTMNFGFLRGNKLKMELESCSNAIKKVTGKAPYLFRPPFGITNPSIAKEVKRQKLLTIGWNVRSFDSITDHPEKIVERVIKKVNHSSIVLLHDNLEQTCEALPELISKIKGMGIAIGQLSNNNNYNA